MRIMWLFELIGGIVLIGTAMGLAWRFGEDWLEKRNNRKHSEVENDTVPPTTSDIKLN